MIPPARIQSPVLCLIAATALAGFLCLAGNAALASEFWVSPSGSDSNAGTTSSAPWKTIGKARDYIRTNSLNQNMTADLVVNLAAGEYLASTAISFGVPDSGSNGHSVIYRAADGPGTAILVGGTSMKGWTQVSGTSPIWKVNIGFNFPAGKAAESIFENGMRGMPARIPHYVADPRYPESRAPYYVSGTGGNITLSGTTTKQDWIQYNAGEFTWPTLSGTDAQVMWWKYGGTPDWGINPAMTLRSVDPATCRIYMDPYTQSTPSAGERYYVRNIYEFLGAPGEFYYSSADGWLYYYPRTGNPNTADVRVPLFTRLLTVSGTASALATGSTSAVAATYVHHLKFEGIQFKYTNALDFNYGALGILTANHIEIVNCEFAQVGHAVRMYNANTDNLIYGCYVHNTAVAGIEIYNTLKRADFPNDISARNVVSNCKFEAIGEALTNSLQTAGVLLWSTSNCEVSYCDISSTPRYAISLRGHWSTVNGVGKEDFGTHFATGNVFKYIRATDCMSDSGDGALVHAAHCNGSGDPTGADKINYWQQMLISGAYAHPSMKDYVPNGIFLDHPNSCLYQSFTDIKISDTQDDPVRYQKGPYRTNGNAAQTLTNVSWSGTFNESRIEYSRIGLKADFPTTYDSRNAVLCDDHTGDYTEFGVTGTDSELAGHYRGDGRRLNSGSSSQYGEWRPNLPRKGSYQVSVWTTGSNAAATSAAPYTITYQGGSATATVDQQNTAAGWVSLGTFPFAAGRSSGTAPVRLGANSSDGKPLWADAVKFEFVGFSGTAIDDAKGQFGFEGNGNDASGLGHAATGFNVGYSSSIKAVGSQSLSLSGTAYAEVTDSSDLDLGTGDFSIAGWFYSAALLPNGQPNSATLCVLSKGAGTDSSKGYAVWAGPTSMTVSIGNGTERRSITANHLGQNLWNHFVVNISRSGYLTLYVNGQKASTSVNISDWRDLDLGNTDNLDIGRNVDTGAENWVGYIDDVALYQRLLDQSQVSASMTGSAPTDIFLSNTVVPENQPVGTLVGTLSTADVDTGDTSTFTLVSGTGSADNAYFTLSGSSLQTAGSFNYEARSSYGIRVRATDQRGLWVEKAFTLLVSDVSEQPFKILSITGTSSIGYTLQWTCEAGYAYQVRYSDTLAAPDWQDIGPVFTPNNGQLSLSFTDTTAAGVPRRFYKVVRTPLY